MAPLIDTLTSYVPRVLANRLVRDPTATTIPTTDDFPAAVFFADISGFTALADRLAEHGPAGVEGLTGHLNAYFGQLVDLIVAHGGDVLKFAGDAAAGAVARRAEPLAVAVQRAAAVRAGRAGDAPRLRSGRRGAAVAADRHRRGRRASSAGRRGRGALGSAGRRATR